MFADDELKDFDFEELDNEIGLGELLKQKDNFFVSLLKKIIFGILVILIGIMVFYASFTIGKVLFLSDSTVPMNPYEQEITNTAGVETPVATITSVNENVVAPEQQTVAPVVSAPVVVKQEAIKPAPTKQIVANPVVIKQEAVKPAPVKQIVTSPIVVKQEAIKVAPVKQIVANPVIVKKEVVKEPIKPITISVKNIEPVVVKAITPVVQPTPIVAKETTATGKYVLFAGTFGLLENAKKVQSAVAAHGFSPEIKTIVKNNTTFYRVIVGSYNDIVKANSSKKVLDSAGIESFLDSSAK
ncbi:MAG: SPOR domain-containing protein [Candidatus Riflemargulisbacteria bacterium]